MKIACIVVLVAACGGKPAPPPAQPLENKEPRAAATPPAGEMRVVGRSNTGGVLELVGDREAAMRAATQDMGHHCGPNNFTIVQEGEEPVETTPAGVKTAWRVHYQCNN